MAADSDRVPSSRTPAFRHQQVRQTSYAEADGATFVHKLNQPGADGVDLPTTAPADTDAGMVFSAAGVDLLTVYVDLRHASATAVHLRAQSSWVGGREGDRRSDSPEWYDVLEDVAGDGALVAKDYVAPVTGDTRLAFRVPVRGKHMRFKVWAPGSSTDRATVRIIRSQDGRGN